MKVFVLVLAFVAYSQAKERIIYPEDLPEDTLISSAKLSEIEEGMKNGTIQVDEHVAERIFGVLREKRAAARVSKAWCCKQDRPSTSHIKPIRLARVVKRAIPAGGSVKCGLWGMGRCASQARVTVEVTEYYTDSKIILVPSNSWKDGCPEPKVTCCEGYIFRKNSDNCLTLGEYERLMKMQLQFCHTDLRLLDFKWDAVSRSIPCPIQTDGSGRSPIGY